MTGWYVVHQRYDEEIPGAGRLGRHKLFDSRSLGYPYQAPERAVTAVRHQRHIGILDQGQVGSCTGNAMVGALGTSPDWDDLQADVRQPPALNETEALHIYSAAETIDGDGPYPPNDNGSTGQSVAKAAKNAGLISGYTWCTSSAQIAQALQDGPVLIGIDWYSSFDTPASDGLITIGSGAYVRGGHELVLRGVDPATQEFFGDNSWGTSWGPLGGSFIISYATMDKLLAAGGDCVVPVPLAAPAPVPVPVPPTPVPVTPVDVDAADLALDKVGHGWSLEPHVRAHDIIMNKAYRAWRAAKGLT